MPEIGRVVGRLWATSKYPDLAGATLQIVVPLSGTLEPAGEPFVAADTIGAGPGDLVLYVTAYEAVIPYPRDLVPLDASLVAIVDGIDIGSPQTVRAKAPGAPSKASGDPKPAGGARNAAVPKPAGAKAPAAKAAPRKSAGRKARGSR